MFIGCLPLWHYTYDIPGNTWLHHPVLEQLLRTYHRHDFGALGTARFLDSDENDNFRGLSFQCLRIFLEY